MSLSEASEWLEQALQNLNSDGGSALHLDPETLHSLVIYCERAPATDAREYLLNIVGDDRSKDVVAEYLLRRGGPNSVPDAGMQAYHKPRDEESYTARTKKNVKSKAGTSDVSGSTFVQKDSDHKSPLYSGHGVLSSENIIQKGKRPVGKGKKTGKGVSLGEATKGSLVFARNGPCTCQCTRHNLINNCLFCGRIVCEQEGEGPCHFCGALVLREGSDYGGLEGMAVPPSTEEDIKAEDFKNRLVEYDRTAASRTTVIDDQSDYFELDGNKWLTEKEKELLQKQLDEEERAAEERRKRVVVTIDLLGRKVVMAEPSDGKENAKGISILGMDTSISQEQPLVSRVKPNPYLKQSPVFVDTRESSSSGRNRTSETLQASARNSTGLFRSDRIQHDDPIVEAVIGHNVDLEIETEEQRHVWHGPKAQLSDQIEEEAFYDCRSEPSDSKEFPGMAARVSISGKDQHRVAGDKDVRNAADRPQAFDICPTQNTANSRHVVLSTSRLAKKQAERKEAQGEAQDITNLVLMPGMVVLRRWLSPDQQVEIVSYCRTAGIGSGGFYKPQYGKDSKMHLQMMCLGMQWEPELKAYGTRRTNFDNAQAPPIPESFVQLVDKALVAARAAGNHASEGKSTRAVREPPSSVPVMAPSVCIVNFYERTGNLGMHQDKDESAESLKQAHPIVSFSIGDSAEFVYGKSRDISKAEKMTLESGDVLIFGGPSRMIYHGVTHVFPDSCPQWLSQRTGLRPGRLNLTFRQV